MAFLQSSNIQMFISPPNETGVTQMLDQLNKIFTMNTENAVVINYNDIIETILLALSFYC